MDSGADLHVSKPVHKDALASAIKSLIRSNVEGANAEGASARKHTG